MPTIDSSVGPTSWVDAKWVLTSPAARSSGCTITNGTWASSGCSCEGTLPV